MDRRKALLIPGAWSRESFGSSCGSEALVRVNITHHSGLLLLLTHLLRASSILHGKVSVHLPSILITIHCAEPWNIPTFSCSPPSCSQGSDGSCFPRQWWRQAQTGTALTEVLWDACRERGVKERPSFFTACSTERNQKGNIKIFTQTVWRDGLAVRSPCCFLQTTWVQIPVLHTHTFLKSPLVFFPLQPDCVALSTPSLLLAE